MAEKLFFVQVTGNPAGLHYMVATGRFSGKDNASV
jgi:hypothetical protein